MTAIGAKTDVGRKREVNEDSFWVNEPLFVVADGMGGHVAGDIASSTAVDTIKERSSTANPEDMETLAQLVLSANSRIWEKAQSDHTLLGMGTTCTLLLLDSSKAHIAHVGDSRAYLLRDGELTQITEDHTLVGRMVKEGRLTEEEAEKHPQRSVVTRALGVDSQVEVDLLTVDVQEGDRIVICSDGLSSMIGSAGITRVLEKEPDPQRAADGLVEAANEAGGEDNITVVVVDVGRDDGGRRTGVVASRSDTAESASPAGGRAPDSSSAMTYGGSSGAVAAPPAPQQQREHPRTDTAAADEARDERPARTWPRKLVAGLVIVVLLGGGALFGSSYLLRNSWYVGVNGDGFVTIYEGIPEEVAGLSMRAELEVTDIELNQLPDFLAENVSEGIKKESLEDARAQIENLEAQVEADEQRRERERERERERDRKRTKDNAKD
ncbi:MAG: Stp1/IreP family PP2C-type Ser/Thr phosphatase [Actinomycetota bacterium]